MADVGAIRLRRRRPVSCTECRRRKLRCNRLSPCSQCVKTNKTQSCRYASSTQPPRGGMARDDLSVRSNSNDNLTTAATDSGPTAQPQQYRQGQYSNDSERNPEKSGMFVFNAKSMTASETVSSERRENAEIRALRDRVHALETALAASSSSSSSTTVATNRTGCSAGSNHPPRSVGPGNDLPPVCFRKKNEKTRYFGRSHWTSAVSYFDDVMKFLEHIHQLQPKHKNRMEYRNMKRLKNEISSKEKEEYLIPSHMRAFRLQELLPDKQLSDKLLDLYLSTFETTYRILHVPKFLAEYNAMWTRSEEPKTVFMAKLLALMASATCFYSANKDASPGSDLRLNKTARGWALAVQSWVSSTMGKERINVDVVQIQCLLLIAGNATSFEGELGWVSSGALVRNAMMLGLHRDPCHFPKVNKYWAEIRRRLWTTVVELDMQAALENGMPPSISLDEYDTTLPANVKDEELVETMANDAVPISLAENFTRTSFQLVLARSLPVRMRIAKLVNRLRFDLNYDEALQLNQELISHLRDVPFYFRDGEQDTNGNGYASINSDVNMPFYHNVPQSITFAVSLFRFLIHQSLLILHRPFALRPPTEIGGQERYLYSRKLCIESCLALLAPLTSMSPETSQLHPHSLHLKGRMLREEIFHAAITICLELKTSAREISLPILPSDGIGKPTTSFANITDSRRETMCRAVESTIDYFATKLQNDRHGCKVFLFLYIGYSSAQRVFFEPDRDIFPYFQEKCINAVTFIKALLRGASWAEIKHGPGHLNYDTQQQEILAPDAGTHSGTGSTSETPALSVDESFPDFDLGAFMDIPDLSFFDFQTLGMI